MNILLIELRKHITAISCYQSVFLNQIENLLNLYFYGLLSVKFNELESKAVDNVKRD